MQTLFLIGLIVGSLFTVVALTLLLRKIPTERFVFAGYAAIYTLFALGVGK